MNKKLIITPKLDSEDGNCYIKCLQEVYCYYGIDITTSEILVLADCFSLSYDTEKRGKLFIYLNYKNLDILPIDIIRKCSSYIENGILTIKNNLLNNNPVVIIVNTYYLHYTNDYLKTSGGYFQGGHAILVTGFDDDKECFTVCDPTFKIKEANISYKEMWLAWTYTKDAPNFKPLIFYCFNKRHEQDINYNILQESLIKSFKEYISIANLTDVSIANLNINKWLSDFENSIRNILNADNKDTLLNIEYSIFHEIRWSRKSLSIFFASYKLPNKQYFMKFSNTFSVFFHRWSNIYNLLHLGLMTNNNKRIIKAYSDTVLLLKEESEYVKVILDTVK